ncbi:MAG TPA: aminotransferase class III-fold pyridoxal phosphate-dependent enzyme [Clostridiaceae bacterium]|nr:aminotransferase class III-fold pyridoxal phosphate-dependent enzyme [Clostridiaceae bacterium]
MKYSCEKTQDLYRKAKKIIPGGTQLLSKRPEMFAPEQWPGYFSRAKGCEVWDLDGNHYYDMTTNGIGACLLGFADPDVSEAVKKCIDSGSMCTLNAPEEVELAEMLLDIHPWADMARFARTGGETAAIAIRIARATTDKTIVAICGYHGWHDWYLAANLGENDALRGHLLNGLDPLGVPRELRGTNYTFRFNCIDEFMDVINKYGDNMAAVIMEPCRNQDPDPEFIKCVREETKKRGIILIFDEITIGWRRNYGGAHLELGVYPDIAIFGKALGNGHPIGAVIGTREAMEGADKSFISSTYWTESVGYVAAIATLKKMKEIKIWEHAEKIGNLMFKVWKEKAAKHGLDISTGGYPCLAHFSYKHEKAAALKTLYTQLMLERGFLGNTAIYVTAAHNEEIVEKYSKAIDEVFAIQAEAIKEDKIEELLKGPVCHSGFKRLL